MASISNNLATSPKSVKPFVALKAPALRPIKPQIAPQIRANSFSGKVPLQKPQPVARPAAKTYARGMLSLIEYSNGFATPAAHKIEVAGRYNDEALFPVYPMRQAEADHGLKIATQADLKTLECGDFLSVMSFQHLQAEFQDELDYYNTQERIQTLFDHPLCKRIHQAKMREVEKHYNFSPEQIKLNGVFDNHPGLPGTTIDRTLNQLIGLHVDSWDKGAIAKRRYARNRICMNLGKETRRFMIVNMQVADVYAEALRMGYQKPKYEHPSGMAKYFLQHSPNVRIYAIQVPPWCAYIAPTENVIHDGNTMGRTSHDFGITTLGNFMPKDGERLPTEYLMIGQKP